MFVTAADIPHLCSSPTAAAAASAVIFTTHSTATVQTGKAPTSSRPLLIPSSSESLRFIEGTFGERKSANLLRIRFVGSAAVKSAFVICYSHTRLRLLPVSLDGLHGEGTYMRSLWSLPLIAIPAARCRAGESVWFLGTLLAIQALLVLCALLFARNPPMLIALRGCSALPWPIIAIMTIRSGALMAI